MKFFARSAFEYIRNQIEQIPRSQEGTAKLLIMIPIVPARVAIEVCRRLEAYCAEKIPLVTVCKKIALELCHEWRDSMSEDERAAFQEAYEKGWYDDVGNLTRLRHSTFSIVLLIGTDHVTDASSLADFHRCDIETIWIESLKGSFSSWIFKRFEDSSVSYEENNIAHFNRILKPLIEHGLADVLQISSLLENLDFSAAQDGRDAEKVLLKSLGAFGLPRFSGYRFARSTDFGIYLEDALSFFSYDMFREERARLKALNTIDRFFEAHRAKIDGNECFEESERQPYGTDDEFLKSIWEYINSGDSHTRNSLRECDFVTIRDRILKFKRPKGQRPERVKKLSGGPVEVLLHALWITLGDFKRKAAEIGVPVYEAIERVTIDATLYKHDSEGESADERQLRARTHINRLAGGVDAWINQHVNFSAACGEGRQVSVESKIEKQDINCQHARTSEPSLEFAVTIFGTDWKEPTSRVFAWRLPKIHPYRLAEDLILWAVNNLNACHETWRLPVFHVPYYEELLLAKDDEETRRILMQCIQDEGGKAHNLLSASGFNDGGILLHHIQEIGNAYEHFLVAAKEKGLHASLIDEWIPLRQAYEKACSTFLTDESCSHSPLATMLLRAFLIIRKRHKAEADRWVWQPYEQSGVVTVLHPALLEMLEAHIQYLLACFNNALAREFRTSTPRSFHEGVWQSYVDLAAIQMPLTGLIRDSNLILDTNVRGEDLIHRIGDIGETEAALTTRLLLRYEAFEDEEITDAEIFRETRESKLLYRVMWDYWKLHPHAEDGLSIAVYRNKDIQPIIAAVHSYLIDVWDYKGTESDGRKPYAMNVTIFTESSDDTSVARWVEQWRERWEAAETEGKFAHYRETLLSVSHRIVSNELYYQQFKEVINDGLEVDIVFLNDFIGAGTEGNDFEPVSQYDVTSRTLKFPILEKAFCSLRDPGKQLQRARILSNRQFRLSTLHAEVMARLKHPTTPQEREHVVLGFGDYTPWQGAIDVFHERAEWVVCIDPNIDERLIEKRGSTSDTAREIIGFGSGVGSHGEANYTVSTEQFALSDVLHRLKASIIEVYPHWPTETYETIAKSVLKEARKLSGLSLVRATGIGDYIRDFMAYSLARKILHAEDSVFCDQLVSLDAYRHWFDTAESDMRPDLLWLVGRIGEDGKLHLDFKIIECKQAKRSDEHLEKARQQIENGLRHLVPSFMPRVQPSGCIDDDRPDQRYWWLQLHRLIASKSEIKGNERTKVLTALEQLADGDYSITWGAAALAFWSDVMTSEITCTEELPFEIEGKTLSIGIITAGSEYVRRICCEEMEIGMPWPNQTITFVSMAKDFKGGLDDVGKKDEQIVIKEEELGKCGAATNGGDSDKEHREVKAEGQGKEPSLDVPIEKQAIPERILLGTTVKGNRQVYWEFGHNELNNRHMMIFGSSGMGKTYTIECLLCELGRYGQNSLIIDYTNGFSEHHLEPGFNKLLVPKQHVVRKDPLPINPFRRLDDIIGAERIHESVVNTAQRVAGVFAEVYTLGEQQKAALYAALKNGLDRYVDEKMSLNSLIEELQGLDHAGGPEGKSATTIISKITPFVDMNPFGPEQEGSWDRLFQDQKHRCHVIQLVGFMKIAWRLIVEFSLIDLYAYYRTMGSKDDPRVVVLDEVQNLDQREDSPLAQLLREGRKFGFSLILATQIMSNLQKDERDRLFLAGHKLFFRPADTEMRSYADIAAVSTGEDVSEWMKRLAQLQKGECYSLGPSKNDASDKLETRAFRIKVASLADRGFNG